MITIKNHNLRSYQSTLTQADYHIELCSEQCIYKSLPANITVVTHGFARTEPAIVSDTHIWINISGRVHNQNHPLYIEEQSIQVEQRSELLEKIKAASPEHIVPIRAICNCGMMVDILDGLPLADINTRPAWHRKLYRSHKRDALENMPWDIFSKVMADLVSGLQTLHAIGIAHGDAFPINTIVTNDGKGYWLDLNSIIPSNNVAICNDIIAFINYTFLSRLLRLREWKPEIIEKLLSNIGKSPISEILPNIRDILLSSDTATSVIPLHSQALGIISEYYEQSGIATREDELGRVARLLTTKGLWQYYNSFEWNANAASERERYLSAEQVRHRLVERELHYKLNTQYSDQISNYNAEIARLKNWVTDLERGKAWLEEQRVSWQAETEKNIALVATQRNWIEQLEQGKIWLEEQRVNWQEEVLRLAAENERLNNENASYWNKQVLLQQEHEQLRHEHKRLQERFDRTPIGILRKVALRLRAIIKSEASS